MPEPTKVALQYNHKSLRKLETNAGARERAGFMDAPDTKDKKKMSSPIILPIATPPRPLNPFV